MKNAIQQGEKRTRNKICIWKIYKILSNRRYSKQVFFYFNQLGADKQRKKLKLIM